MRKLKRKNLDMCNKKRIVPESGKGNIAFSELVTIFNEEAYKICKNRRLAKLVALKTLQEYVLKHTKNLTIVL